MTLPARRQRAGRLAELGFPGWTRDPLAEFDDLFNRMGRLLETTVGGGTVAERAAWVPLADVSETEDAYVVEADLPGIKAEDVNVEISDRELIITGEFKEGERKGALRHGTRRTGHFEYRALLSSDVKADEVSATLTDGVLTLNVPKSEAAKPHRVEIAAGD